MWTWPGCVALVTTIFFSRRLRDKTLRYLNDISPFIKREEYDIIKNRLKKIFVNHYHVTFPLVSSFVFAVPFQVYFLVLNPWEFPWAALYQHSNYGALAFAIATIIQTWIWLFSILTLGYFSLGVAYVLNKLEKELRRLSVEHIDKGVLKPPGNLLMCMTTSFLLGVAINLALIIVAPLSWWAVSEIFLFVASALLLFFVPLYNLHVFVVNKKDEALRSAKTNWWKALKKRDPSGAAMLKDIQLRIEQIPSWHFNTRMLLELLGYIVIPCLLWLVSYLFR